MPTDVRCLVETDESSAVVRLTGVLDRAGVGRVRDALLHRLWQRPGPLIVDLSGLRIAEPGARAVVDDVHRTVADWPAAGVLVLDPAGRPGDGPAVYPSLGEARAALAGAPPTAVVAVDLPPVVGAAREARALVTDGCARWGVPELAEPACIAVTEMVNNVVAHAGTAMTVRVAPSGGAGSSPGGGAAVIRAGAPPGGAEAGLWPVAGPAVPRALHLAVRDHSGQRPAYAGLAPVTSTGGRGLLLIDTVARRWGSTPLADGKVVWCVLHAEDETARRG